MSPYQDRIEAAWCNLDHDHFVAAQQQAPKGLDQLTSGCIDAPELLPSGSMHYPLASWWRKGQIAHVPMWRATPTPAYRDEETKRQHDARHAMAEHLIAELLAEESAST